jgi:hypothetical protein
MPTRNPTPMATYKNSFLALQESESDSDSDSEYETVENSITVEIIPQPVTEQSADPPVAAAAPSQQEQEGPVLEVREEEEKQQVYRTWIRDESENRFAGDEVKKNIFSSPFSKHKKSWSQQRGREDSEGWVSIRWTQPQFEESTVSEPDVLSVEYEPRTEEMQFPSLLTRGNANIPTRPISSPEEDAISASMWAEKIKKSLEKAEQNRIQKQKEEPSPTRLSFFKQLQPTT